MTRWHLELAQGLKHAKAQSLLRSQTLLQGPQQTHICVGSTQHINFSSNDYLGWANDEQTKQALLEGAQRYGVGSGASHWVVGHTQAHEQLELRIGQWLDVESVALFATGYLANLGALSALSDRDTLIHQDRLNHASLLQAGQLAGQSRRFAHCDPAQLDARLTKGRQRRQLVVSDGVFSMDGNVAPIADYRAISHAHEALLMIDDAHGFGVLGPHGKGACNQSSPDLLMGTLGKAIGCAGAFLAGPAWIIDYVKQFSKPYTYTTALSPALAYAASQNIQRLMEGALEPDRLAENIRYLRSSAVANGVDLLPSDTAIQPLIVGDAQAAVDLSLRLREKGLWVTAIRPPTVPAGSARLRIALSAAHTKNDIDRLIDAIVASR